MYACPIFVTSLRGGTFVDSMNMNMEPDEDENSKPDQKWILAGAACLLTEEWSGY